MIYFSHYNPQLYCVAVSGWADAPASTELDSVDAMWKTRHAEEVSSVNKCGCVCYLKTYHLDKTD